MGGDTEKALGVVVAQGGIVSVSSQMISSYLDASPFWLQPVVRNFDVSPYCCKDTGTSCSSMLPWSCLGLF